MPSVLKRVDAVKNMRLASPKKPTRDMAVYPTLFAEDRHPSRDYIIVPEVSSERRQYLPIGFVSNSIVSSNLNYTIPDATPFVFGVISSSMHMAWVRSVAGRLESRYRYSSQLVYNTFPWPSEPTKSDAERVAFLFELYHRYTSMLPAPEAAKRRKRK